MPGSQIPSLNRSYEVHRQKGRKSRSNKKGTGSLVAIDIIIPEPRPWHWQKLLVDRLQRQGHDVAVYAEPGTSGAPLALAAVLGAERRAFRRRDPALASA